MFFVFLLQKKSFFQKKVKKNFLAVFLKMSSFWQFFWHLNVNLSGVSSTDLSETALGASAVRVVVGLHHLLVLSRPGWDLTVPPTSGRTLAWRSCTVSLRSCGGQYCPHPSVPSACSSVPHHTRLSLRGLTGWRHLCGWSGDDWLIWVLAWEIW